MRMSVGASFGRRRGEGKTRAKRYRREDVDTLKSRKMLRRDPTKAVETALHFGAPVLESAITLIANGHFFYRGYDVLALATKRTIEEVAGLIWLDRFAVDSLFPAANPGFTVPPLFDGLSSINRFQVALSLAAGSDLAAYDFSSTAVAHTGARILTLLTWAAARQRIVGSISQTLQKAWIPDQPELVDLFNAALILCADHELNVSSFTARCVASAGSTPYAVVTAGLAALQGSKHGGYTERVESLFRETGTPDRVLTVITSRLRRGEGVPGFGHKLYPDGDPRARLFLSLLTAVYPDAPSLVLAQSLITEMENSVGLYPNVDFGLVTLAWVIGLPPGGAMTLFALGRIVGWIGQAIEQYQKDQIIRPRARYIGEMPVLKKM